MLMDGSYYRQVPTAARKGRRLRAFPGYSGRMGFGGSRTLPVLNFGVAGETQGVIWMGLQGRCPGLISGVRV